MRLCLFVLFIVAAVEKYVAAVMVQKISKANGITCDLRKPTFDVEVNGAHLPFAFPQPITVCSTITRPDNVKPCQYSNRSGAELLPRADGVIMGGAYTRPDAASIFSAANTSTDKTFCHFFTLSEILNRTRIGSYGGRFIGFTAYSLVFGTLIDSSVTSTVYTSLMSESIVFAEAGTQVVNADPKFLAAGAQLVNADTKNLAAGMQVVNADSKDLAVGTQLVNTGSKNLAVLCYFPNCVIVPDVPIEPMRIEYFRLEKSQDGKIKLEEVSAGAKGTDIVKVSYYNCTETCPAAFTAFDAEKDAASLWSRLPWWVQYVPICRKSLNA